MANVFLTALITGAVFGLMSGCTFLIFHPTHIFAPTEEIRQADPRDVFFPSSDGVILHGWLFMAKEPKGTLMIYHGNAENITTCSRGVLWLVKEGFNIFIVDYRGYGLSTGRPNLEGVHQDGLVAFDYLLSLPGINKEKIAVLGQSLGGSVAAYTAAVSPYKNKIKLLILDSTFYSYKLIAKEKLAHFFLTWAFQSPLSQLFNDDFCPGKWVEKVACPVIVINDAFDKVVPSHHSWLLYREIKTNKEIWTTRQHGHISSLEDREIREALISRLSCVFKAKSP